jgi:hypothetical protein
MILRVIVFYVLTWLFTMTLGGLQQEAGGLPGQTFLPQAVDQRLTAAERAVTTENVDPALRDLMLGNVATIRAYILQPATEAEYEPRRVSALCRQAEKLLPEDELGIHSVNGLQIASAHLALGNLPAARVAYEETFEMAKGVCGGRPMIPPQTLPC